MRRMLLVYSLSKLSLSEADLLLIIVKTECFFVSNVSI